MFLADTSPSPQFLSQFISVVALFAGISANIIAIWSRSHVQKREVSFTREYASKEELQHVAKDVERIEKRQEQQSAENKADRTMMMAAADERMEKLSVRVDRLVEGVARWEGVKK